MTLAAEPGRDGGHGPDLPVTIRDIEAAASRLSGLSTRTPVLTSRELDGHMGASLHLKAEHLQRVGAFKFRGACNAIAAMAPEDRERGVVAFSSGNHGQAIACAAGLMGIPATIVMPADAPPVKRSATAGYGAEVVTYDRFSGDRVAISQAIADERNATIIPPFDDPDVIAGQGTAALELMADVEDLDLLVVPVGGGGLLAGCAVAAVAVAPGIEIIGVEPAGRRAARDALASGSVVDVPVPRTVLDGQQGTHIGRIPLAILRRHVDRVIGIDDDAVIATVRSLALRAKQVIEPSGASALAAIVNHHIEVSGRRVGVMLSGGNIAPLALRDALGSPAPLAW